MSGIFIYFWVKGKAEVTNLTALALKWLRKALLGKRSL